MKSGVEWAMEAIAMSKRHHNEMSSLMHGHNKAVTDYGCFYFLGRKVLLTFADNGLPTNEDPEIRRLFGDPKVV